MNKKMITLLASFVMLATAGSAFAAASCCNPAAAKGAKSAEKASPARQILTSYEKISNALAADDLAEAQAAARTFAAVADISATKLDCGSKKKEECHSSAKAKKECDKEASGCTKSLQALIDAKDIEEARAEFKAVSAQAIQLAKAEEGYFVMTCPMAGENADWLQSDKEIRNPYHGSKMLRCGKVKTASADAKATEG